MKCLIAVVAVAATLAACVRTSSSPIDDAKPDHPATDLSDFALSARGYQLCGGKRDCAPFQVADGGVSLWQECVRYAIDPTLPRECRTACDAFVLGCPAQGDRPTGPCPCVDATTGRKGSCVAGNRFTQWCEAP